MRSAHLLNAVTICTALFKNPYKGWSVIERTQTGTWYFNSLCDLDLEVRSMTRTLHIVLMWRTFVQKLSENLSKGWSVTERTRKPAMWLLSLWCNLVLEPRSMTYTVNTSSHCGEHFHEDIWKSLRWFKWYREVTNSWWTDWRPVKKNNMSTPQVRGVWEILIIQLCLGHNRCNFFTYLQTSR